MSTARLTAVLLATSLLLASVAARAQCTKDTDCKGDRVCEAGRCVESSAAAPSAPAPQPTPAAPASPPAPAPVAATAPSAAAPAAPAAPPVAQQTRRFSGGLMATGIVMISLGAVALLGAMGTTIASSVCKADADYDPRTGDYLYRHNCDAYEPVMIGLTVGGIGLLGAGIPLAVIGGKREPVNAASAAVAPWVTPAGAGAKLAVSF
ncbi:MAG TPA: hypothetical protein VGK73_15225 [Polyangiaceae bacterium]